MVLKDLASSPALDKGLAVIFKYRYTTAAMIFHSLIHPPKVYEFIQNLFGAEKIREKLRRHAGPSENQTILDVGAGTGIYRAAFQSGRYIALELDPKRVNFLVEKRHPALAVVANAAALCFKDKSMDIVLCVFLAHHLSETDFPHLLREVSRVARGKFIFIDPLADSKSWMRKCLWKLDQGHNPRSAETLLSYIQAEFEIEHQEQFKILHRYLLCVATPKHENSPSLRPPPTV